MFIHLHNHTEFSLLDGASKIDALVAHVSELGQSAVAITDHGWVAGAVKLTKACKEKGIKPIVGSEVYVATQEDMRERAANPGDNYHLTLLCATPEGYVNLRRLTSLAYLRGLSFKPRIDKRTLRDHSDGLIILSGCVGAELPQRIIAGDAKGARRLIEFYQGAVGDRFFIELMAHGSDGKVDHVRVERDGEIVMGETELNAELVRLAHRHSVPLVATNDAHYLRQEDGQAHDALLCLGTGGWLDKPGRLRFPGAEHASWEFFVKDEKQMLKLSKEKWWREACNNTAEVARLVADSVVPLGQTVLPRYTIPHDPGYLVWKKTGLLV